MHQFAAVLLRVGFPINAHKSLYELLNVQVCKVDLTANRPFTFRANMYEQKALIQGAFSPAFLFWVLLCAN